MRTFKLSPLALSLSAVLLMPALSSQAVAQESQAAEEKAEVITVTGSRVSGRTAAETAVPVDIISGDDLAKSGTTELNQALATSLPSFNFPRPGLADGTDTVRPATLRGLSPDQSLVLVNGKRRHSASLVNVNGTIGRGASAVDLNSIPMGAVGSVEVLRDGASAQYGSDAIAGVLNVKLREASDGGNVSFGYSYRDTEYTIPTGSIPANANWSAANPISRSRTDGDTIILSGWKGLELGNTGFLTLSFEYKDADRTERGGYDVRQQYPLLADGSFDPREATIERFNAWYGEPEVEQTTLFANAGIDLNGGKLYGWAGYQKREAVSGGFYRRALDARNVIEIYPDGFLPLIAPTVDDLSAAVGYEWVDGAWDMDASLVYGSNKMSFDIINTLNRSIGPTSKTEFDAGGFDYNQLVLNFSGARFVTVDGLYSDLSVAAGVEARREAYGIFAGEPDSYRNGGVLLNGSPTASGAQVFPGFRPASELDKSRTAVGVYLDLEANVTEKFLASVALRAEDYSDFGSNVTGKFAGRYDVSDDFAIRGSVQNGFRAPSLQQQYFTTTSTNFIGGVPFDITTFSVDNPVAVALGAQPLDAEDSFNYSLGVTFKVGEANVTIDAYQINVDDRIVLSENLTAANVRQFLENEGFIGSGGGRFFINGVDTETQGVDVVVNYPWVTDNMGSFNITFAANFNDTKVTRVPSVPVLEALSPAPSLFSRVNIKTFEEGTPDNKFAFTTDWNFGEFGATFRATRYGDVLVPNNNAANDYYLDAKVIADIEGRWDITDNVRWTVGIDNIADTYPVEAPIAQNGTGNTPFSNYSPFGRAGRLVYTRLSYNF
jgi:iron complex outermembrane recepter protein